jgi:protease I
MSGPPRRVLLIIAPERFRDEELTEPRRALLAAGHVVRVASTRPGTAVGMRGAREAVDGTVAALARQQPEALVVVGGDGAPAHLWDHEPLRHLVREVFRKGGVLGAICLAPPVLARAGVLANRRATTYPSRSALIELARGGARYLDQPVVRDGTILTASGPEAAAAFASELVHLLGA